VITVVTRGFFFLSEREVPIPNWLRQGLRYAPLAALAAVVVPEIVMHQGRLIATVLDARIYAALALRPGSGGGGTSSEPSSWACSCCCHCGWVWAGEAVLEFLEDMPS
jgi:hypothetical protein